MLVWSCGIDRVRGPDGFSFRFVKKIWENMKNICNFLDEFFEEGVILNGCNSSFITLTPKIDSPSTIKEYITISLIGVQYRIVTKL